MEALAFEALVKNGRYVKYGGGDEIQGAVRASPRSRKALGA